MRYAKIIALVLFITLLIWLCRAVFMFLDEPDDEVRKKIEQYQHFSHL